MRIIHNCTAFGFPVLVRDGTKSVGSYYKHAYKLINQMGLDCRRIVKIVVDVAANKASIGIDTGGFVEFDKDSWVATVKNAEVKKEVYLTHQQIKKISAFIS